MISIWLFHSLSLFLSLSLSLLLIISSCRVFRFNFFLFFKAFLPRFPISSYITSKMLNEFSQVLYSIIQICLVFLSTHLSSRNPMPFLSICQFISVSFYQSQSPSFPIPVLSLSVSLYSALSLYLSLPSALHKSTVFFWTNISLSLSFSLSVYFSLFLSTSIYVFILFSLLFTSIV